MSLLRAVRVSSLIESLHLKVQNKRSRGHPGDIDLSY